LSPFIPPNGQGLKVHRDPSPAFSVLRDLFTDVSKVARSEARTGLLSRAIIVMAHEREAGSALERPASAAHTAPVRRSV
jgi:hypothetical protein